MLIVLREIPSRNLLHISSQLPDSYLDIRIRPHIIIMKIIQRPLRAPVFKADFIPSHQLHETKLDHQRVEKAARTCVLTGAKVERSIRHRSIVESVDVDGLAKPEEAVPVEPLWIGVYLGVMVHAVGVKQNGRAGRDVQSVFECVWFERVALAGDCDAGGLVLAGVLIWSR